MAHLVIQAWKDQPLAKRQNDPACVASVISNTMIMVRIGCSNYCYLPLPKIAIASTSTRNDGRTKAGVPKAALAGVSDAIT